jgi:hypothetical protein
LVVIRCKGIVPVQGHIAFLDRGNKLIEIQLNPRIGELRIIRGGEHGWKARLMNARDSLTKWGGIRDASGEVERISGLSFSHFQ